MNGNDFSSYTVALVPISSPVNINMRRQQEVCALSCSILNYSSTIAASTWIIMMKGSDVFRRSRLIVGQFFARRVSKSPFDA